MTIQRETLFSGHSRAAAHMNSQWLWLYAQDLNKIQPRVPPEDLLVLIVAGRMRVSFL